MKTIQVQGKGSVSQAPDQIRLTFRLTEFNQDYQSAVDGCNRRIEILKKAALGCGIEPDNLKTSRFSVSQGSERQTGRLYLEGFNAKHDLVSVLPIDMDLVGRCLSSVMSTDSKPGVSIGFEVSDTEGLKQQVLTNAVENAKRRAQTIAEASGVKLGQIVHIDYGYSEVRISSFRSDVAFETAGPVACEAPDIDPEDLEAEDSVRITWEITP